jgi:hypothetical protein
MSKYLDKTKVERAFKVAARTAVSGSRDARSGRFSVQKDERRAGTVVERTRKQK